ncbi:MAG: hypothetical protein GY847_36165 [Proteobacteria bacterium]|nr:hypothetical protein [Pseudomonadota bacterium]
MERRNFWFCPIHPTTSHTDGAACRVLLRIGGGGGNVTTQQQLITNGSSPPPRRGIEVSLEVKREDLKNYVAFCMGEPAMKKCPTKFAVVAAASNRTSRSNDCDRITHFYGLLNVCFYNRSIKYTLVGTSYQNAKGTKRLASFLREQLTIDDDAAANRGRYRRFTGGGGGDSHHPIND